MELRVLLDPLDLPRIAHVLDGIGDLGRIDILRGWHLDTMETLFEAARGLRVTTIDDLVPADTAPLVPVIHEGMNSLAMFNHFQKRFCRAPGEASANGAGLLYGYNHQPMSGLTGPGYFVARNGGTESDPENAGEVVIDYTAAPSLLRTSRPEGWPPLARNEEKLGRFVYAGMQDVVRALSRDVFVGRAKRRGFFLDAWFVLARLRRAGEARV